MDEQLALLIELQKAESEINKINVKCRDLPEEILKLDGAFKSFQTNLEEQKSRFADIQKSHREKEEKLKKDQESLKRGKGRLGEVRTNKEYQAVLKEIEIVEGKNSDTEDEIIALLEIVDATKDDLRIKEREMEARRLKYEGERKKIEEELQSLDRTLLKYSQKNNELKNRIASGFLKRYEAIKMLNNGLAVVAVWKEICGGCHMNIPPQLYIEVQRSMDLHTCPNCNRIIYWHDRNEKKN